MLAGPLSYYQQQQTSLTALFADKYLQGEQHLWSSLPTVVKVISEEPIWPQL